MSDTAKSLEQVSIEEREREIVRLDGILEETPHKSDRMYLIQEIAKIRLEIEMIRTGRLGEVMFPGRSA